MNFEVSHESIALLVQFLLLRGSGVDLMFNLTSSLEGTVETGRAQLLLPPC
jgi:hypothetical protein